MDDYIFVPDSDGIDSRKMADGSDALNYVTVPIGEEISQLDLMIKLDDTLPDSNPGNNSDSTRLTFGIPKALIAFYSRAKLSEPSTGYPEPKGIELEKEFLKQAWPVAPHRVSFLELPDTPWTTSPLTGEPASTFRGLFPRLGFLPDTIRGVRYVYFVDRTFFTPLTAASPTGALTIASNASNQASLSVALVGNATGVTAGAVATVSAAHYKGPELAAESIVSAFGSAMATGTAPATSLPLPTSLAGTTVRVRDSTGGERLAPLFYVSPTQINYLIPIGTAIGPATIIVTSSNGALSIGAAEIVKVVPGFFTANQDGTGAPAGFAIRVKANGEQSREPLSRLDAATGRQAPAPIDLGPAGEIIILELYGTGLRGRSAQTAVSATMGGVAAGIEYADRQPGFLGLDQVNLRVPRTLIGRGEVDLVLTVESRPANTVRVHLK